MDESLREKFSRGLFVNEVRKWEDRHTDCLVKIFQKVEMESMILHLPLVCKSWYKTSLDPQCWKILDFKYLHLTRSFQSVVIVDGEPPVDHCTRGLSFIRAIKFAVNRSCGMATEVVFPFIYFDSIQYVLERCGAALKSLTLPDCILPYLSNELQCLPKLINRWNDLESLSTSGYYLEEVLTQIQVHCKKFVSLTVKSSICSEQASAIVTFVPNIKHLVLTSTYLPHENLIQILSGCRELELLDVRHCNGFNADDAEILTMASHIKTFMSEGSWEEEEYYPDYEDPELYAGYISG